MMQCAIHVRAGVQHRAVDDVAGLVHFKGAVAHLVTIAVDLDEVGRRDFVEQQPQRIEQKVSVAVGTRAEIWVLMRSVMPA